MRLDKYLKVSRLIKRRSVAKEVADKGRITVQDKVAKSSTDVDSTRKEDAKEMFTILEEKQVVKTEEF